jgi:hypothetical protein
VTPPVLSLLFWTKSVRGKELLARTYAALFLSAAVMLSWMFVWELPIFGDPLYFSNSEYSAHEKDVVALGQLAAWGNIRVSIQEYIGAIRWNIPDPVLLVGIAGTAIVLLPGILWAISIVPRTLAAAFRRRRRSRFQHLRRGFREATRTRSLFSPVYMLGLPAFYVVSLYLGQNAINSAPGELLNIRYGLTIVPFVGVAVGVVVGAIALVLYLPIAVRVPGSLAVAGSVVAVAIVFVPLWSHPLDNTDLLRDLYGQPEVGTFDAAHYLRDHYDGGMILSELLSPPNDPIQFRSGLPSRDFLTEALPSLYNEALADPAAHADWVMVGVRNDTPLRRITETAEFNSVYKLAFENELAKIYVKRDHI